MTEPYKNQTITNKTIINCTITASTIKDTNIFDCEIDGGSVTVFSGWIPVSERLPDFDTDILMTDGKNVGFGAYNSDSEQFEEHFVIHCFSHDDISHWSPLPPAPEVK